MQWTSRYVNLEKKYDEEIIFLRKQYDGNMNFYNFFMYNI